MCSQCSRRTGENFRNLLKTLWFSNTTVNKLASVIDLRSYTTLTKCSYMGNYFAHIIIFSVFFTLNRNTDNILSNFICKSYVIFLIILICFNIFPKKSVIFFNNLKIKHIKIHKSVPIFFNKMWEYMCCFIFIHFIIPFCNIIMAN